MKVAVLGAGFTGLTAALRLLQAGHQVILIEKEDAPGGLAGGFTRNGWEWTLEKAYHHWFTNDYSALNLAKEVKQKVIVVRPKTDIHVNGQITTLDSPTSLLKFSHLSILDRLRMGLVTLYLKLINNSTYLEKQLALKWLRKFMGQKPTSLIWEPLFTGKFGNFRESISLTWFWARIKKRTPSLAYPEGGFKTFAEKLAEKIKNLGGEILLNTQVLEVKEEKDQCIVKTSSTTFIVDKVISTFPSPIFIKVTKNLPQSYIKQISSIPHLHALNLILVIKKPFFKKTYWLNITDTKFPFLVLAEHTNFMSSQHYNGDHLLYIGNYLPEGHPFLKMSAKDLLAVFDPYLKKINPTYQSSVIDYQSYFAPFAQPIVSTSYKQQMPKFHTPLANIYLANLDMVYPWDRGTNYAIELGEKIAKIINEEHS